MSTSGTALQPGDPRAATGQRAYASQWQLMRWRFLRHRVAVVALGFIGFLYLGVIFAEFISPYDPLSYDEEFTLAPPQRIRFFDADGRFHLRPFVHPIVKTVDPDTWEYLYSVDTRPSCNRCTCWCAATPTACGD